MGERNTASNRETDARPKNAGWILAATIIGSSMVFIDGTVVNIALPAMQAELQATVADLQWLVESYALFLAALLLVGGSLGDRYGRRKIFALGVILFAAASAWCSVAGDVFQLILARGVQGIGGALLTPGSLALIGASFGGEERGKAIGTWSGFSAISTALGPVLGGWLVEHASWRWAFLINVPLAAIVLAITLTRVPESRDEEAGRLDWPGAALATAGLGGIVYALIESTTIGFGHPRVVVAFVVGVVVLASFFVVEARSSSPMMPLGLFRSRSFSGTNLLTFLLYAALGGALFFLPLNMIQVQGYTATEAGAAMLPFILILFLLSRWAGSLVARYSPRVPLTVGPIVAGIGFLLHALPGVGGSYWTTFFPAIVVLGLGMAISVAPLTATVMGAVEKRHSGLASGINNAVSRTAGLLAVAVFGVFMLSKFNSSLNQHFISMELPGEITKAIDAQRSRLADIRLPETLDTEMRASLSRAIHESFVSAFRRIMMLGAALAIAGGISAWFVIDEKKGKAERAADP